MTGEPFEQRGLERPQMDRGEIKPEDASSSHNAEVCHIEQAFKTPSGSSRA